MYLSNSDTLLLSNGNFMIFKERVLNPDRYTYFSYEISSFDDGLNIEVNQYGQKSCSNHTGNICLINGAHNNNLRLPIHDFLKKIPENLLLLTSKFLYAQTTMLQLCARYNSACDLLNSNNNLLWLLAGDYYLNTYKYIGKVDLYNLLSKKQRDILNFIYPKEGASNYYINLISKVILHQANDTEYSILETAINKLSLSAVKSLNHWPQIPIAILAIINEHPLLIHSLLLKNMAKGHTQVKNIILKDTIEKLAINFRDTLLLAKGAKIKNFKGIINKIKTKQQLDKLHDRWLEKNLANKDSKMQGVCFPKPPILGNDNIIPLITEQDLFIEGKFQHHCVHTYTEMVEDGSCYIYKMLEPERCTIELIINNNKITTGQIYKKNNEDVSNKTTNIIMTWFDNQIKLSKRFSLL